MFGRPDGCGMTAPFRDKGFIQCYEVNLNSNVAGMSSDKLFDEISKLEILKYYVIFVYFQAAVFALLAVSVFFTLKKKSK